LQSQEKSRCNGEGLTVASDEPFVCWVSPNIGKRVVVRDLFQFENLASDDNGRFLITRMELNKTNKLAHRKRLVYIHLEREKTQRLV